MLEKCDLNEKEEISEHIVEPYMQRTKGLTVVIITKESVLKGKK